MYIFRSHTLLSCQMVLSTLRLKISAGCMILENESWCTACLWDTGINWIHELRLFLEIWADGLLENYFIK